MALKKLIGGTKLIGTITIATSGLTACGTGGGGVVDALPSPLMCSSVSGQDLNATATIRGTKVSVLVTFDGPASWSAAPSVTRVTGATAGTVTLLHAATEEASFDLDLKGAASTKGSFTLKGQVTDGTTTCAIERTFTFSVTGGGTVMLAELDEALPLRAGELATIHVVRREGSAVRLHPRGASEGSRVTWTATAGEVDVQRDGGAIWTLPSDPGLYQVELVVERGDVLAVDTLALEVT